MSLITLSLEQIDDLAAIARLRQGRLFAHGLRSESGPEAGSPEILGLSNIPDPRLRRSLPRFLLDLPGAQSETPVPPKLDLETRSLETGQKAPESVSPAPIFSAALVKPRNVATSPVGHKPKAY